MIIELPYLSTNLKQSSALKQANYITHSLQISDNYIHNLIHASILKYFI